MQDDPFLRVAIHEGGGIHILRQDLWETVVSFTISQRNNIPRISKSIETLCENFGTPLKEIGGQQIYAFPTPDQLLWSDLSVASLGYREPYIRDLCRYSDNVWRGLRSLSDIEAKQTVAAFYANLDKYLDIAKNSLEIKREWLQKEIIDTHMLPAYMEYVGTINNHFSTIGVIGMNEMCENFMGKNILDPEAKQFCVEVGNHIRQRLLVYQEETGHLYNYEATPAESTCYRFALADRKIYPDIITQGSGLDCYYTNSCHIPVSLLDGIDSTFKHQEELQTQFTGGTVIHVWEEGAITGEQAKAIVKAMCENYRVPYMSLSPISRYCDDHGYIQEKVDKCPYCKQRLKKYQRITGYLRCVDNFNRGKKAEFSDRVQL